MAKTKASAKKKQSVVKSAAKKPAAKKPARAANQPAAKKLAAKQPPIPKTVPKPTKAKALDWVVSDGLHTESRAKRAATATTVTGHPMYAKTYAAVLKAYRESYPSNPPESDETILAQDPNDFDMDPSPFYEWVEERFGVPGDPDNQYFNGFGGPIRDLISFLTPRWDGKLRN